VGFLSQIVLSLDSAMPHPNWLGQARRAPSGNRRASSGFHWQFKFQELDDDSRLAYIAKEKFGFAVCPGGSDPASVANLCAPCL
jgi:hypothetical protein